MPLENERDTVVLISEPDTDFSRDLPGLFVAAVQGANGDESATPTNILQIGYLRGLDGQVTEKTRSKTQPPPFCLLFSSSCLENAQRIRSRDRGGLSAANSRLRSDL